MLHALRLACFGLGTLLAVGSGLAGQDAKEQLRQKLKDSNLEGDWVYDDIEAGFAEAKETGKPLLVVFR